MSQYTQQILHQRFLLTGVQAGLELKEPAQHLVNKQFSSAKTNTEPPIEFLIKRRPPILSFNETYERFSSEVGKDKDLRASKVSFSCATVPGTSYDWPSDDFFEMFDPNFEFIEHGSSLKEARRREIEKIKDKSKLSNHTREHQNLREKSKRLMLVSLGHHYAVLLMSYMLANA